MRPGSVSLQADISKDEEAARATRFLAPDLAIKATM